MGANITSVTWRSATTMGNSYWRGGKRSVPRPYGEAMARELDYAPIPQAVVVVDLLLPVR
jgi:hypothetical protein